MAPALTQLAIVVAAFGVALVFALPCSLIAGGQDERADRYQHVDGMRGLAAVGVVATHVGQYVWAFLGNVDQPLIVNHVGILGVQVFFALTAFLFTERALKGKLTPEVFYIGRIRRIVPLYAFMIVGALTVALVFTRRVEQPLHQTASEAIGVATFGFWQTPELTFRGMNMLSLVGIAWTLSYEWLFYLLLVPIFHCCQASKAMRWLTPVVIGVLAIRDFSLQSEQVIWPFFLPGVVAAVLNPKIPKLSKPILQAIALSTLPAIACVLFLPGFWTPTKLALGSWIFLAILISAPVVLRTSPLRVLGRVSYSIYLLQYLILFPVIGWSHGLKTVEAKLLACGSVIALIVLAAGCSYRWIELRWLPGRPTSVPADHGTGFVTIDYRSPRKTEAHKIAA